MNPTRLALAASCLAAMLAAASHPAAAQVPGMAVPVRSPLARSLMARWEDENRRCMSQKGAAIPCARRQLTARKLRGLGWCYGKIDLVGALYDWHRCRAGG